MNGKQLKNSILQWAIQGKLVPQDPNDEPASVLLEKIRAEKARLVKEGKIKRDKKESIIYRGEDNSYYEKMADGTVKCIDDEIPFEIPASWEWCRLTNIVSILGDGIHGTPEYNTAGEVFFINGNNLTDGRIVIKDDTKKVTLNEASKHFRELTDRTVLVSINGTIGNVAFYQTEPVILGKSACYFNLLSGIDKRYIKLIIETDYFLKYAKSIATGSTIKNVPLSGMRSMLVPLPCYNEQTRISNAIEQVKPLIFKYSRSQDKLDSLNYSLNQALRKSILQEAIQGKLVPQITSEGDASGLLQQIEAEKQKLVKEGKWKKKDLVSSTIFRGDDNKYYEQVGTTTCDITDEIPFDLPLSWQWVRLGSIVRMTIGKTPARGDTRYWLDASYPWVSISDMSDYSLVQSTKEKISEEAATSIMGEISPAETLIMSFKLTVGRTSILDIPAYHNEAIVSVFPFVDADLQMRNYLFYVLPILANRGDSKDAIKGKTLNSKSLNNLLIPLPPFGEQRRIVVKIEELFDKTKG